MQSRRNVSTSSIGGALTGKSSRAVMTPLEFPADWSSGDLNDVDSSLLQDDDDHQQILVHVQSLGQPNASLNAISKACWEISQWLAVSGHSSDNAVSTLLVQYSVYGETVSAILTALSLCAMQQTDRRGRLLALQTLPAVAGTALSNLYGEHGFHDNHPRAPAVGHVGDLHLALYTSEEPITVRRKLEDDICHGVVADTLLPLILNDDDEMICICALHALGHIVYGGVHWMREQQLSGAHSIHRHLMAICDVGSITLSSHVSSYTRFLPWPLITTRIMDSILLPRMRQVLHRITLLKVTSQPIGFSSLSTRTCDGPAISSIYHRLLTPTLIHLQTTEFVRACQLLHGNAALVKRASEFDSQSWIREYVHNLLIPILQRPALSTTSWKQFLLTNSASSASSSTTSPEDDITTNSNQSSATITTTTSASPSTAAIPKISSSSIVKRISIALVKDIDFMAALAALQLCTVFSTSPKQTWVDSLSRSIVMHLLSSPFIHLLSLSGHENYYWIHSESMIQTSHHDESFVYDGGDTLKQWMGLLLYSARGLPLLEEKLHILTILSKLLLLGTLPAIESIPQGHGRDTLDLVVLNGTRVRPARLGFWISIALNWMGPTNHPLTNSIVEPSKSNLLSTFFSSLDYFLRHQRNTDKVDDVLDGSMELVLVFCSVYCLMGEWLHHKNETMATVLDDRKWEKEEIEDWLSCSVVVLTKLSFCLSWEGPDGHNTRSTTIENAAQIMFLRLFHSVLQSVGYTQGRSAMYLVHVPLAHQHFPNSPRCTNGKPDRIHSLIDLMIRFLSAENPNIRNFSLFHRSYWLTIIVDAWIHRLFHVELNDTTLVQMESQVTVILRSLAEELQQTNIQRSILLVYALLVESLATAVSEWADKQMKKNSTIPIDSIEILQSIVSACLQTIAMDELRDIFKESIEKIRSLVHETLEMSDLETMVKSHAVDMNKNTLLQSSLEEGLFLSRFCTITLKNVFYLDAADKWNAKKDHQVNPLVTASLECISYDEGYLVQIYRQVILDRCIFSFNSALSLSFSKKDTGLSRPYDPFQVAYPVCSSPIPERDISLWPGSVVSVLGSSDPINVTVAYAPKLMMKNSSACWTLTVLVTAYNVTPATIPYGVEMNMNVISTHPSIIDGYPQKFQRFTESYKKEIDSGECFQWEVNFSSWPFGKFILDHSITFRSMEPEEEEETLESSFDVTLCCEPVEVSLFVTLRPHPLVFFRHTGDETSFNFLWLACPYTAKLQCSDSQSDTQFYKEENISGFNHDAPMSLAKASSLKIKLGDDLVNGWAFRTWCGYNIIVISHPSEFNKADCIIQVRSDNPRVIELLSSDDRIRHEFTSVLIRNVDRSPVK